MLSGLQYIEGASVHIELKEVLRFQGYRSGVPQKESVLRLVQSAIDQGYELIQPRAVYRIFSAQLCPGGKVRLEDGSELSIGKMAGKWVGLKYAALAICTIGPALGKRVSELFESGKQASAVMLDSVGSVAVESLADHLNNLVCQQALSEGYGVSPRVSPGYGDWSVQEQKTIFSLLPGEKIGVTLTEGCMMQPVKSVSFAVGMGEGLAGGKGVSRCHHCSMVNCQYRAD